MLSFFIIGLHVMSRQWRQRGIGLTLKLYA